MENDIIDRNELHGFQPLPNATAVLVLGILSIVFCFCYGLGVVLGIIAIVLSNKSLKAYNNSQHSYSQPSYKNLNAGRICAIIGTSLSGLYLLFILIMLIFLGNAGMLGPMFNGFNK